MKDYLIEAHLLDMIFVVCRVLTYIYFPVIVFFQPLLLCTLVLFCLTLQQETDKVSQAGPDR